MALGPIARALAQVAVLGISVLARALPAAYSAAVQNAKKNGVQGAASVIQKKNGMMKAEALEILNITEKEYTMEQVQKVSQPVIIHASICELYVLRIRL